MSNSLSKKMQKLFESSQNNEKHISNYLLEMEGLFEQGFELNDRYILIRDFDQVSYIDLQEPSYEHQD
jgi:hypothetical protein